jgi:hypothetical protein
VNHPLSLARRLASATASPSTATCCGPSLHMRSSLKRDVASCSGQREGGLDEAGGDRADVFVLKDGFQLRTFT